jgi:hypothetical protein
LVELTSDLAEVVVGPTEDRVLENVETTLEGEARAGIVARLEVDTRLDSRAFGSTELASGGSFEAENGFWVEASTGSTGFATDSLETTGFDASGSGEADVVKTQTVSNESDSDCWAWSETTSGEWNRETCVGSVSFGSMATTLGSAAWPGDIGAVSACVSIERAKPSQAGAVAKANMLSIRRSSSGSTSSEGLFFRTRSGSIKRLQRWS